MKLNFKKLNMVGAAHIIVPLLVIVGVGIVGSYMLVASHADTVSSAPTGAFNSKPTCTLDASGKPQYNFDVTYRDNDGTPTDKAGIELTSSATSSTSPTFGPQYAQPGGDHYIAASSYKFSTSTWPGNSTTVYLWSNNVQPHADVFVRVASASKPTCPEPAGVHFDVGQLPAGASVNIQFSSAVGSCGTSKTAAADSSGWAVFTCLSASAINSTVTPPSTVIVSGKTYKYNGDCTGSGAANTQYYGTITDNCVDQSIPHKISDAANDNTWYYVHFAYIPQ